MRMREGIVSYLSTSFFAAQPPPSQRERDWNSACSAVLLPEHREWCDPRGLRVPHCKIHPVSSWGSFCHSIWTAPPPRPLPRAMDEGHFVGQVRVQRSGQRWAFVSSGCRGSSCDMGRQSLLTAEMPVQEGQAQATPRLCEILVRLGHWKEHMIWSQSGPGWNPSLIMNSWASRVSSLGLSFPTGQVE